MQNYATQQGFKKAPLLVILNGAGLALMAAETLFVISPNNFTNSIFLRLLTSFAMTAGIRTAILMKWVINICKELLFEHIKFNHPSSFKACVRI